MPTATLPAADRLTFEHADAGNGYAAVVVTEHRATRDVADAYAVEAERHERPRGYRAWLFLKLGGDNAEAGRVHRVVVADGGRGECSCIGNVCRRQTILCRHLLAVLDGIQQGVW